ncbi:hypothetical protein ABEB36_006316 [Hypothenemus hampei]|uniref:Biogenesis of lysosome-related organelles complex 1 subunit 3 n=1 Tax=Hypothenemus hampei TaxID=57062 RepID=A0ABD1EQ60_HYPHA
MSNSLIICGEASETDSEDERTPNIQFDNAHSIQGAVVLGEDSESDHEENSVASAISALELASGEETVDYESLFQQKLRESNVSLYNNVSTFVQSLVNEAENGLNSAENKLLKSQITLQGAVTSLKTLGSNSVTLKSKLHSLLSSKFLSNVKDVSI